MSRAAGSHTSGAVFGRYVLVEQLGHNSARKLWVAIDVDLDRKVALELPRIAGTQRGRLQARLASLAGLSHRSVATIHDSGEHRGQLFFAREYVAGEGLDSWLSRGPYAWQEALALMRQVGEGLGAAHEVGLVHGCLEPSRVIRAPDGRACIVDFGLSFGAGLERGQQQAGGAASAAEDIQLEAQTDGRVLRAKPRGDRESSPQVQRSFAYLAPEQLREELVDARADVFALCCMLFEALYGVLPFPVTTRSAALEAIDAGAVVELPEDELAPAWIHRGLLRGLAARPEARYSSIAELLAAFELSPRERGRRRLLRAGLVGLALASIAAVFVLRGARQDPCALDASALEDSWSEAHMQSLAQRLAQLGERGRAAATILEQGLEHHASAWLDAQSQLCREQLSQRSTAQIRRQREACLEHARVGLEALAELGDASDAGVSPQERDEALVSAIAAHPHEMLRSLGRPRACLEARVSERDTRAQQALTPARFRLQLLFSLVEQPSAELARAVLSELAQVPAPERGAEVELLYASAMLASGDRRGAQTRLEQLAQRSVVARPALAARAWSLLARLELDARAEVGDARVQARARHLLDYAEALAPREALDLRAELVLVRTELALAGADPDHTRKALTQLESVLADVRVDAPDLRAQLEDARELLGKNVVQSAPKATRD